MYGLSGNGDKPEPLASTEAEDGTQQAPRRTANGAVKRAAALADAFLAAMAGQTEASSGAGSGSGDHVHQTLAHIDALEPPPVMEDEKATASCLDATEPRLEQELSEADNVMAVTTAHTTAHKTSASTTAQPRRLSDAQPDNTVDHTTAASAASTPGSVVLIAMAVKLAGANGTPQVYLPSDKRKLYGKLVEKGRDSGRVSGRVSGHDSGVM